MSDEKTTLGTIERLLYDRDAAVFAVTSGVTQPSWEDLDETARGRYRQEALYIFNTAEPVWRARTEHLRTQEAAWDRGYEDGFWYGRYEGQRPENPYRSDDD